jgi:Sulfotransferase domain
MGTPSQTLTASELEQNFAAMLQQQIDLGTKALEQDNPDMAMTFFRSGLSKVDTDFEFYDHLTHNLLLAYRRRIEQLLFNEHKQEAKALMSEALALDIAGPMVDDDAFRHSFADLVHGIGLAFFESYEPEACLECCRRAMEIRPSAAYHVDVNNSLALLNRAPLLSDFTDRITEHQLGRHIFIACVPKSASTFLKNILLRLTAYRGLFPTYSPWQTEQEIYLPAMIEHADVNTVTQQHCRASEANIQIMQAFKVRPVILVRNIFDAIVSMTDFYRQGAYFNSYFRAEFPLLDEKKQVDMLINNVVPWYLQFVSSWQLAEREGRLEIYWLEYEELTENKVESVQQLLEFYGLGTYRGAVEKSVAEIESEKRRNRFNKGVVGRGKTSLTDAQKQRIIALTEYYPATDFSRIGL